MKQKYISSSLSQTPEQQYKNSSQNCRFHTPKFLKHPVLPTKLCNTSLTAHQKWETQRGRGERWGRRFGIYKITPAFQIQTTHRELLTKPERLYLISNGEMLWNNENPVGHMVPFPMTLESSLYATLAGIVSKDSVRQDHKPLGYAHLSQTNAIRHSGFR